MKTLLASAFAAVGTLCPIAGAQVIYPPIQVSTVSGPNDRNGEPIVVASPLNGNDVLVAWNGPTGVNYRLTLDGFVTLLPSSPAVLPPGNTPVLACALCPAGGGVDPFATASRVTGHLYLGAVMGVFGDPGGHSTLGIARKRLGQTSVDLNASGQPIVRYAAPCNINLFDRPTLVVGPKPPDLQPPYLANEAMYVTSTMGTPMRSLRSVADPEVGSAWECDPANPGNGYPAFITSGSTSPHTRPGVGNPGVVIHSGDRAGRLIVASCEGGPYSEAPPEITWTDKGGGPLNPPPNPWTLFQLLDLYGNANAQIRGIVVPGSGVPVPAWIRDQVQSAPSIATDPLDPSNVYVAFIGRSDDTPDQIHLFIAWANTGNAQNGPVFQGAPDRQWSDSRQTYRILDSWLLVPGDPTTAGWQAEQYQPALAIDHLGGINLTFGQAFHHVSDAAAPSFTIRYARWPSRAALAANQPPFLAVLSPPAAPWPPGYGNDYMGVTASGCLAYAAWASSQPTGRWHIYVNRIVLPCPADADASGIIDGLDPITFVAHYAAQQPQADVNDDGTINPQDYSDFIAAYACGACPIP